MHVPEKVHAELGASVAARWMNCPGSIRLSRQVPVPPTSDAAEEGTRAHAVAELCLRRGTDPADYIGEQVEGGEVTEDMADAVRLYVEHCLDLMMRPNTYHWIERKFSLGALNPPAPMFGTSDFVAYDAGSRLLDVADLKFGAGVLVEVLGSKQLRYYALGALLSLDEYAEKMPVEKIRMTIVQPRMAHADGAVRSEVISIDDLLAFASELMVAARLTQTPDAPLAAGSHCKFCPAEAVCPARREQAQSLAQIEFSAVEPSVPPAPSAMPIEMVVEMLPQMDVLEDWIKACRAHVRARLEAGLDVPGYKLVATRATRKWTGPAGVEAALRAKGFETEEIFDMDLKSPAQIEKLMGKKVFNAHPVSAFVEKKSSGHKMVPDSDPAPAIVIARGEEFLALPSGSEE